MDTTEELVDDPDSELIDVIIITDTTECVLSTVPTSASEQIDDLEIASNMPSPSTSTSVSEQIDDLEIESNVPSTSTSTSDSDKTYRKQKFSEKWLELPEFKGWLEEVKDDYYKVRCLACDKILTAGKSEIQKHANSSSHKKRVSQPKVSIKTFFKPSVPRNHILAELRYALLVVDDNLPFNVIDDIVTVSKMIFSDSKIADIKCKRTKCSKIVTKVLSPIVENDLEKILSSNKFSLLVDESTDLSNVKYLCLLVRYFLNGQINTSLLDLIPISAEGDSAKSMYMQFKNCVEKRKIDLKNIVGFCSDNANVMIGIKESFSAYLKKDCPNLYFQIGCMCHTTHLIASHAAEELPRNIEGLLSSIYNFFSRSPKRQALLHEIQELFKSEKHKLIHPSRTRWLCLLQAVNRVLEQWQVLQHAFLLINSEEKHFNASFILNELNNPFTKAYLYFMQDVLPLFNDLNCLFQSERPLIAHLGDECSRFIRLLGSKFMTQSLIDSLDNKLPDLNSDEVKLYIKENSKEVDKIILSDNIQEILNNKTQDDVLQFKQRCLIFYQRAMEETLKRMPHPNSGVNNFKFLLPANVFSQTEERIDLQQILDQFSDEMLDKKAVLKEWALLLNYFDAKTKEKYMSYEMLQLWDLLQNCTNYKNEKPFSNISALASIILSFPHANADVERVFAVMNDIKTKKRNKLSPSSLSSILRIKLDMKAKNKDCKTYELSDEHIKLFKSSLMY